MPHILIADDQRSIAHLWARGFLQAGYTVDVVYSGRETLSYLKKHDLPDLLILDNAMPDVPGSEVVVQLKKIDPERKMKVYFITADPLTFVNDLETIRNTVDEFMQKPVLLRILLKQINEMFGMTV